MDERRSTPRLRVLIKLYGNTVPLGLPITLVDISPRGLAFRADVPFPPDAEHGFELTVPDGSVVRLNGRVTHCEAEEDGQFVTGISLTGGTPILDVLHKIKNWISEPDIGAD